MESKILTKLISIAVVLCATAARWMNFARMMGIVPRRILSASLGGAKVGIFA
jgi:hypothetical protein